MSGAQPMVPSWVWDLAVLAAIVVLPLTLWIWSLIERVARIRQQRMRALDEQMSRGMKEAWRRGWIQDGDQ